MPSNSTAATGRLLKILVIVRTVRGTAKFSTLAPSTCDAVVAFCEFFNGEQVAISARVLK